jgi:hypothetical protein
MDPDLESLLRGLEDAAAFAKSYRFELTSEYLALIDAVEALPRNQPGADKSGRWLGSHAYARSLLANVSPSPPER